MDLSHELAAAVKTYAWQCMECKLCVKCGDVSQEDKIVVCDECDRGYHTFCADLKDLPQGVFFLCGKNESILGRNAVL